MILQPISQGFLLYADANYELAEMDWEDDADTEEKEDKFEEDIKIRPLTTHVAVTETSVSSHTNDFYYVHSDASHSVEILIPPPELI